jgi:hypothetical protein
MKTKVGVGVGVAFLVLGLPVRPQAGAAAGHSQAVFVADLPDVGTIYARYSCTSRRTRRFALGIHVLANGQSTDVRFRAGRFRRDRNLQPGDSTSWFASSSSRVEWLAAAAGGENGTVVASVRVVGYPRTRRGLCARYSPPRATVQIYPRRYYVKRDFLRRLIG